MIPSLGLLGTHDLPSHIKFLARVLRFHATRLACSASGPGTCLSLSLWDDMFLDTEVQPVGSASNL